MKYYQNWFFIKNEGRWYEQVNCTCYNTEEEARAAAEKVVTEARRECKEIRFWKTEATK